MLLWLVASSSQGVSGSREGYASCMGLETWNEVGTLYGHVDKVSAVCKGI